MRDGKGYLLPENPQPEGLLCLKIYIPDDPTGYYLAAMSGAYSDMSRWTQWEKDGTNRASLAAATWKDAVDFTYENGWLNCGDMDCCDEILDRLTNLEALLGEFANMNINVNCGCGCGCGCGCKNGTELVDEDGLPLPNPIPPIPSDQLPDGNISGWLCDAANEFVDRWIDFYGNMFNLGIIGQGSLAAILSLAIAAGILTGGIGTILILIAAITILPAATAADWIRDWLAENKEGLICAMVSSPTPAAAYSSVLAYLAEHKSDQHGSFAGAWIERVIQPVLADTDWNLLYNPDSFVISSSNAGSDCSACQAVGFYPNNVPGYEWRSAIVTSTNTNEYTLTHQNFGDGYKYTALIDDPPTSGWSEQQEAFFPDLQEGEEIVAFAWKVVNASAPGASDPLNAVENWNVVVDGPWWVMRVSNQDTVREDLENAAPFDLITEVNPGTYFVEPLSSGNDTGCAITPGFSPPVSILLEVRGFVFCVKLA